MSRLRKDLPINRLQKHGCVYSASWLVMVLLIVSETPFELEWSAPMFAWGAVLIAHIAWRRFSTYRLLQQRRYAPLRALSDIERLALHSQLIDGENTGYVVRLVGDDGEFIDRA